MAKNKRSQQTIDDGIPAAQKKAIIDVLSAHPHVEEIYLTGERARGEYHAQSDIQLLLKGEKLTEDDLDELREELEHIQTDHFADISCLRHTSDTATHVSDSKTFAIKIMHYSQENRFDLEEWRESTWGQEISLEYGKSNRNYSKDSGRYRVFGSNGPIGWSDEYLTIGPGVILGRKGAYRGVQYSKYPFFVIDTAYYVVSKANHDMRWMYYSIIAHRLGEINDGSPIPSTTRSAVYVNSVSIPPIHTQRAIAHILGSLDDKIELNRKINKTLEAMAQAIFKSWFIDFDPVVWKAVQAGKEVPEQFHKAALRYREQPERMKLDAEILNLFPDEFVVSELGWVPRGWEVKSIGSVVECLGGGTPSTKNPAYWNNGTHPFLTPRDMTKLESHVLLSTSKALSDEGLQRVSSGQIQPGAVLMSSRAPIGYLAINLISVSINQGIIAMVGNSHLPSIYLLHWIQSQMETIKAAAGGTTFPEISKSNFRNISIAVPLPSSVHAFSATVNPLRKRVNDNAKANSQLTQIRDTLLPKLISGELQVEDVDEVLENV